MLKYSMTRLDAQEETSLDKSERRLYRKYRFRYLQYKILLWCPFIFGKLRAKFEKKKTKYKVLWKSKNRASRNELYAEWIELYDTLDNAKRETIKNKIKKMGEDSPLPLFSVVTPTYNTPPDVLREALDSVKRQLYPHWELCIADDASTEPHVRKILDEYAQGDARIKVHYRETSGNISEAGNSALALATGEFVALLDHDGVIPENALYEVAVAIRNNPNASLFYSDEDKLDESGQRCDPHFKPDWNPDLFLSHNFFGHLGVYKRSLLTEIGGFRKGFEGAHDYDLILRCVDTVGHGAVCHIPKILYHRRANSESAACAFQTAIKALEESLRRNKIDAGVTQIMPFAGFYRITYALPAIPPKVSIIIPTRDKVELLKVCINSIQTKTTYPDYEIIVVDNGSVKDETAEYLKEISQKPNVRVLRDDGAFNYSRLNNRAVAIAEGEVICLLNNDIEVITPDWLTEMVSHAVRPDIGAVGAKLYYPNDIIQHAGVVLSFSEVGQAYNGFKKEDAGYFGRAWLTQNYSALFGACIVVRKSVYEEVGGLNEQDLTVGANDMDLCIKIRDAGYRNLWTPFAELYHHESASRGRDNTREKRERVRKETAYMKKTHGERLLNDPAYNPNLSVDSAPFLLAFPPRIFEER